MASDNLESAKTDLDSAVKLLQKVRTTLLCEASLIRDHADQIQSDLLTDVDTQIGQALSFLVLTGLHGDAAGNTIEWLIQARKKGMIK